MPTRRLPKPFTPEELRALYAVARPDVAAAMRLLHATGLRSAEALAITTEEARTWPKPGRLRRRSHPIRVIGKGSKERVVLLNNDALGAARDLARATQNGQLVPWSDRGLRWLLARTGEACGVHCHPHRFRHTAITELVEAGNPIEVVADMAGHSSVDVTRLYYESSLVARQRAERRRWRAR